MEVSARSVSSAALYERLEQVYRLLNGRVGSRSIGSGQGRYLQLLCTQDGLSQTQLAPMLGVSPSTASELTDKLLAAGLVTRQKAPDDRRRLLVYITEDGRNAAETFRRESALAMEDAFAPLCEADKQALFALLGAVSGTAEAAAPPASSPMIRPGKRI